MRELLDAEQVTVDVDLAVLGVLHRFVDRPNGAAERALSDWHPQLLQASGIPRTRTMHDTRALPVARVRLTPTGSGLDLARESFSFAGVPQTPLASGPFPGGYRGGRVPGVRKYPDRAANRAGCVCPKVHISGSP